MTRINLVPPEELTDQHLFAEFREIKMVPKSLARSLQARGLAGVVKMVPAAFTLNAGHVSFFYDKGAYLAHRYETLRIELQRRGVQFNRAAQFDPDGVFELHPSLNQHWRPTEQALELIRARIANRIALKPTWYRMHGIRLQM